MASQLPMQQDAEHRGDDVPPGKGEGQGFITGDPTHGLLQMLLADNDSHGQVPPTRLGSAILHVKAGFSTSLESDGNLITNFSKKAKVD